MVHISVSTTIFVNECCKVSLHDRRRRPVMDQEPTQHSGETALRDRPRTGHARRASLRDRSGRGGRLHAHESGGAHQEHFYSVDGGRRHARPCREAPLLEDATPISRRNSPKNDASATATPPSLVHTERRRGRLGHQRHRSAVGAGRARQPEGVDPSHRRSIRSRSAAAATPRHILVQQHHLRAGGR